MKRALIVGTGTVMGVAAVLALNPDGTVATPAASSATSSSSSGSSPGSTGGSTSGSATYAGSTVDIGHGYGTIAVEITVTDGRLVDITALELPQNDHRSAMISQQAWPSLQQQALEAQSAEIAGVSGATYTARGFTESLRAALTEAGLS